MTSPLTADQVAVRSDAAVTREEKSDFVTYIGHTESGKKIAAESWAEKVRIAEC